jgi:hypothetical protein
VDLFETPHLFYIVLERAQGKDLFDYLKERQFKIPEKRVCEIVF